MSVPEGCHLYRQRIGAFLLGKLEEGGELEAVRAHLEGCPLCRAEAGRLEPVVAALAEADPDRIGEDAPPPPGDLRESTLGPILGEIHRARGRARGAPWSTVAAAALCVLAMGLAGFAWFLEPAAALVEPLSFSVAPGLRVDGDLLAHAWGTEIGLVVSGAQEGQSYRVTLVSEDGERVEAGTFIGAGEEAVRGTFNAALAREDAARVEVRTPEGEPAFFAKIPEEPREKVREWPLIGVLPWADPHLDNKTIKSSGQEGQGGPTHKEPIDPGSGGGTPPPEGSPPEVDVKVPSPGGGNPGAEPPEGSEPGGSDKPPPSSVSPSPVPTPSASPTPGPPACELPPDEQPPTCPQYDRQL